MMGRPGPARGKGPALHSAQDPHLFGPKTGPQLNPG